MECLLRFLLQINGFGSTNKRINYPRHPCPLLAPCWDLTCTYFMPWNGSQGGMETVGSAGRNQPLCGPQILILKEEENEPFHCEAGVLKKEGNSYSYLQSFEFSSITPSFAFYNASPRDPIDFSLFSSLYSQNILTTEHLSVVYIMEKSPMVSELVSWCIGIFVVFSFELPYFSMLLCTRKWLFVKAFCHKRSSM